MMIKVLLAVSLLQLGWQQFADGASCEPVDIVFSLDSSDDMRLFYPYRMYLRNVIKQLQISTNQARVGVISDGDTAKVEISLADNANHDALSLSTLRKLGGSKPSGESLRLMFDEFSQHERTARRIGVVISTSFTQQHFDQAQALKDNNVEMYAVVIRGSRTSRSQLIKVVTDMRHIIAGRDYKLVDLLPCGQVAAAPKPVAVAETKKCTKADIMIVLDSSDNTRWQFDALKVRINNIIDNLKKNSDVQFGLISDSDLLDIKLRLNQLQDKKLIMNHISALESVDGGNNLGEALELLADSFDGTNGDRPDAVNIGLVLTANAAGVTDIQARIPKLKGINMFAIGVGNDVSEGELTRIANGKANVQMNLSDDIVYKIWDFISKSCTATTTTTTPTTTTEPCFDREPCEKYGESFCSMPQYMAWAKARCPKYCKFC